MEKKKVIMKLCMTLAMLSLLCVVLTGATYAWFTSNRLVSTDRVSGRTAAREVTLQLSSRGGNEFTPAAQAELVKVGGSLTDRLMPVSTAELRSFVAEAGTVDNNAVSFEILSNEAYYYHGRIYLRAVSQGLETGDRLAIYFDGTQGNSLLTNVRGQVGNAARLGLIFEGGEAMIFRLSDSHNTGDTGTFGTILGGTALAPGQVISSLGGTLQAVADPSRNIMDYTIREDSTATSPLIQLEPDRIYALDVYFYLEGCDPDCTNQVRLEDLNLNLSFYGILVKGAAGE